MATTKKLKQFLTDDRNQVARDLVTLGAISDRDLSALTSGSGDCLLLSQVPAFRAALAEAGVSDDTPTADIPESAWNAALDVAVEA